MKNTNNKIVDLNKYRDFTNSENIEKFLDKVDDIVLSGDCTCIPEILKNFNDDSEYSWVLENVKLSLEHLPIEGYVNNFLSNLNILLPHATNWSKSFLYGILNHPDYLEACKRNLGYAPKKELKRILSLMYEESPNHREVINELQNHLNSFSN